jgi:acyl carrier protein
MTPHARVIVHHQLASYMHVDRAAIDDGDSLAALGLDALDLFLFARRLEAFDTGHAEFPAAELDRATTVGDLVALVARWLAAGRPALFWE